MPMILSPVDDGDAIVIDKAVIMIGRHPTCDVILSNSRKVSRKHCCVVQVNDKFLVRDLGSMNGIQVNGKKVKKEAPLNLGDLLTVGDVNYRFQLGGAAQKLKSVPVGEPAVSEHERTLAGGVNPIPVVAPLVPVADDKLPGQPSFEAEVVDPVIVADDEILIVDDYEDVEIVDDDSIEIVDDSVEIVDEAAKTVDDVVEVFDDIDIIEVYDEDDFEDVVLLDDDDDFFDGPVEILD
jgi:hypothetical protein